tara:strand:+ start:8129 stop:9304 length:1176 start_codon:yes stop_codon:yes gene_type:complete
MLKNNLFKVVSINLLILVLFTEILGRIFFAYKFSPKLYDLVNSEEIVEYLTFVNHFRFFSFNQIKNIEKLYKKLKPLNINEKSHFIYSKFSSCKSKENCKTIFLQGDSWAQGISQNGSKSLFSIFIKKGWASYGLGTSSFSPSNYSAQLSYLASKEILPDIVILFIDQTDLGDEFYRYKNQIIYPSSEKQFLRVKPFSNKEHRAYYNYQTSEVSNIKPWRLYPVLIPFLLKIKDSFSVRINKIKNIEEDISATPSFRKIMSPLRKKDDNVSQHFKKIFKYYLKNISELGVKELYIITHPHYKNLISNYDESYKHNISNQINQILDENKNKVKINHLEIKPNITCTQKDLTCGGYYTKNDEGSHPSSTNQTYPKISKQIVDYVIEESFLLSD